MKRTPNNAREKETGGEGGPKRQRNNDIVVTAVDQLTNLSDELIVHVVRFLPLLDGPLALLQTCRRFATMNKDTIVHNTYEPHKFFTQSLTYASFTIQNSIRNHRMVTDETPNCGHCDFHTRDAYLKCRVGTYFGCVMPKYICKKCMDDGCCTVCSPDEYGTYLKNKNRV